MQTKSIIITIIGLAALATGCELQADIVGPNAPTEACYDLYSETPCATPGAAAVTRD